MNCKYTGSFFYCLKPKAGLDNGTFGDYYSYIINVTI